MANYNSEHIYFFICLIYNNLHLIIDIIIHLLLIQCMTFTISNHDHHQCQKKTTQNSIKHA